MLTDRTPGAYGKSQSRADLLVGVSFILLLHGLNHPSRLPSPTPPLRRIASSGRLRPCQESHQAQLPCERTREWAGFSFSNIPISKHLDTFSGAKKQHMFRGLVAIFYKDYIVLAILQIFMVFSSFARPLGINGILRCAALASASLGD